MKPCTGQCSGCAFKPGAAANREQTNMLRGFFTALGAIPFYCHHAMGYDEATGKYPAGASTALQILSNRKLRTSIEALGAKPIPIEFQKSIRVCGGWKAAVARLKSDGWFADARVNLVRRHYASSAARAIDKITDGNPKKVRRAGLKDLDTAVRWFLNEAREQGIRIGWLVGEGK